MLSQLFSRNSSTVATIDSPTLAQMLDDDNVYLLDVRAPNETKQGQIKGTNASADWFNWNTSFGKIKNPPTNDQIVVVYCASGRRSAQAAASLEKMGFQNIYNLQHGIGGWKRAGYTTI